MQSDCVSGQQRQRGKRCQSSAKFQQSRGRRTSQRKGDGRGGKFHALKMPSTVLLLFYYRVSTTTELCSLVFCCESIRLRTVTALDGIEGNMLSTRKMRVGLNEYPVS